MADSVVKNANKDESLTARSSYSPIDEMFSDDIPFDPEMDDTAQLQFRATLSTLLQTYDPE